MGREKNEFMQEERRRKEAERIAEDLFHNEKVKFNVGSNFLIKKKKDFLVLRFNGLTFCDHIFFIRTS